MFLFSSYDGRRELHSFPTRRSSDLAGRRQHALRALAHRPSADRARLLDRRRPDRRRLRLERPLRMAEDRKSTRLNSSHSQISYAVFCLKKKKKEKIHIKTFSNIHEY